MEPDSISEIELLSRSYLNQNSNLDEYDDVDTTVLSPRRFPVGRDVRSSIVNSVTNGNDEEDNHTHSSGISSSTINKTVEDIDGVLNEIRLRSSPDPNDFVFRSGNRQYYNGDYYDDDAMTEKSYLTNTNLFHELNRAHDGFMDLGAAKSEQDDVSLLGKMSSNNDDESVDDVVNKTNFDLSWLRSGAAANNTEYDKRRKRHDNSHIDIYENGHVYSPEKKHSHKGANNGNKKNNSNKKNKKNINQNRNFEGHVNDPSKAQRNFDCWNEMSHSEEDLEEALSRVNRNHRRGGNQQGSSTSFLGSKIMSFLRRKRRDQRYQPQTQEQQQQQEQNLPASSSSSSRRETRLSCLAIGCSTIAIAIVITGMVVMGTTSSWSKFKESENSTFIIDTPSWMDGNQTIEMDISNNNTQINSSIIYIDVVSEPTSANSSTILPIVPSPHNSTMSSVTTTNTTLAPTEDPNTSLPPSHVSTVVPLPVSQTGLVIDVVSVTSDSNPNPDRPLPISDTTASNMNYVSSNLKPSGSSSESQSQTVGDISVSGGLSHNNDNTNEVDTSTATSGRETKPDESKDENANTSTNANQQKQPDEVWIVYEPTNFLPKAVPRTPTDPTHTQEEASSASTSNSNSNSNHHKPTRSPTRSPTGSPTRSPTRSPTGSPTKYEKKNSKNYRRNQKRRILNSNGDMKQDKTPSAYEPE